MKFFLEACGELATENICDAIDDLIDRSILYYCKETGVEDVDLKSEDWFTAQIKKALK